MKKPTCEPDVLDIALSSLRVAVACAIVPVIVDRKGVLITVKLQTPKFIAIQRIVCDYIKAY